MYEYNLITRVKHGLSLNVYRTDHLSSIVEYQWSRDLPIEQCLGELALAGHILTPKEVKDMHSKLTSDMERDMKILRKYARIPIRG